MTNAENGTPIGKTDAGDDLHMETAIGNFGHTAAANEALVVVVKTARRELPEADAHRAARDWPRLAWWVHRTRGALVLFGAPELRALGERFEALGADPAHHANAGPAFDDYRLALETWLNVATRHLRRVRTPPACAVRGRSV